MEHLYSLPIYQQIAIVAVVGSLLLCLFCYLYALVIDRARRQNGGLPDVALFPDSAFPTVWDKGYTLLFMLAYTAMIVSGIPQEGQGAAMEVGLVTAVSTLLIYVPMIARLALLRRLPPLPGAFWKALAAIPTALCALFLINICMEAVGFSQWIANHTHSPIEQSVVESFRHSSRYSKLMIAISACICAPVGEECFFRGFVYNILKGKAGVVAAALCSSLYFAAIHGALVQMAPLFLFGLVQCCLYERFRTLWVPMAFHFFFNLLSLSMVFFDVVPS